MDPASSLRKQSASKAHSKSKSSSNKYFDLDRIADGMVEDVTVSATPTQATEVTQKQPKHPRKERDSKDMKSRTSHPKSAHRRSRSILESPIDKSVSKSIDKSVSKPIEKSIGKVIDKPGVQFGSLIITNETNVLLNAENEYTIRFTTGMPDGNGIAINEHGDTITFSESGSYRFELYGSAQPFSELDADLVYYSDKFTPEMEAFYKFKIPEVDGKLQFQNMATILPIAADQTVTLKLVPSSEESIMLLSGARLLISRVA